MITKEQEIRDFLKDHGDLGWFEATDVAFLLAEIDRLRAALEQKEPLLTIPPKQVITKVA